MRNRFVRYLIALFIAALLLSCSTTNAPRESRTPSNRIVILDYELNKVEFQPGRPLSGESFEDAAKAPSAVQVRLLEGNVAFLKGASANLGAEVIGSTDNHECIGAECRKLSLRRAECVYKWLLDHGTPASKLKGPKGDGADYPIGDNNTEEGRQGNRRVQFEFVPLR